MLKMENLERCFQKAREAGANFIGVKISTEWLAEPEIEITPNSNFDCKLSHYRCAYNDDLTLKLHNGTKVTGFAYGDSFSELDKRLFDDIE